MPTCGPGLDAQTSSPTSAIEQGCTVTLAAPSLADLLPHIGFCSRWRLECGNNAPGQRISEPTHPPARLTPPPASYLCCLSTEVAALRKSGSACALQPVMRSHALAVRTRRRRSVANGQESARARSQRIGSCGQACMVKCGAPLVEQNIGADHSTVRELVRSAAEQDEGASKTIKMGRRQRRT